MSAAHARHAGRAGTGRRLTSFSLPTRRLSPEDIGCCAVVGVDCAVFGVTMKPRMYDAIVIGVGGMGSATLYHLARGGANVLGLEQFGIPHALGSSHGSTRIIRLSYDKGSEYVPLLRAAYRHWHELEDASGTTVVHITGGLDIGPRGSWIVEGSARSCRQHGIDYEELGGKEIRRRFPGYRLPAGVRGIFQPDSGYLLSEVAIKAHASVARSFGAKILKNTRVSGWERAGNGLRVSSDRGHFEAKRLVVTAGPWVGTLSAELGQLCQPERQVMLWTSPLAKGLFEPASFPVFRMLCPFGRFYGYPDHLDEGFKIAKYHHLHQPVEHPSKLDRECHPEDEATLREAVSEYFPQAGGPTRKMAACMFTNTLDGDFILDRYPGESGVFVAAGFSGHGFKFCGVVGKIMADFCMDRPTPWDIRRFRLTPGRWAEGRS